AIAPISASRSLPGAKKPSRAAIAAPSSTGMAAALREGARIAWIHIANGPGRAPPSFRIADASVMLASFLWSFSFRVRADPGEVSCQCTGKQLIPVSQTPHLFGLTSADGRIQAETPPDRAVKI